jgi:hypothetical protein
MPCPGSRHCTGEAHGNADAPFFSYNHALSLRLAARDGKTVFGAGAVNKESRMMRGLTIADGKRHSIVMVYDYAPANFIRSRNSDA